MKMTNYHTHTSRCKHAYGNDEDYVLCAIAGGFEILGFSDHSPWKLHPFEGSFYRMEYEELPGYLSSIKSLKAKYKNEITILLSLEAEYFPDRLKWLKSIKEKHLDYLVFGNHYHRYITFDTYYGHYSGGLQELVDLYLQDSYDALKSGLYEVFAHPDIFLSNFPTINKFAVSALEKLCLWSKEFSVPLEYNLAGLTGHGSYPSDKLFKLAAQYQAPVIVNGDCHSPQALLASSFFQDKKKMLRDWGCEVVDDLMEYIKLKS